MKRRNPKSTVSIAAANERRKFVRATLVGSALISPKSGAKAITAVLDNVNKVGAGLHTKEKNRWLYYYLEETVKSSA